GAKGNAAVARANVIDVAGVTASAVLGVDQVNNVVKRCRFTPALVPPVAAAVRKHAGEVPNSYNARSGKARAGVGVRPSVSSISGLVDFVDVVVREAAASFVHAGDVDGPIARHVT